MKGALILALMATYAFCAMEQVGGHYIHVLPALAMIIYVYGLFTASSAGVGSR